MFEKINFHFPNHLKLFAIISACLVIVGVVSVLLLPFGVNFFNLDIDFTGGTTMHYALHRELDRAELDHITDLVSDVIGFEPSSVQSTGDGTEVYIKTHELDTETRDAVFTALMNEYSLSDSDRLATDNVSPSVGKDLSRAAILSAIVAVALMLLYITFRFDFRSGLSAVICLVHDLFVILSVYVIFRIPMNTTFIAAILTILGYSINASVIVFDRVRENKRIEKRQPFEDIVNKSIWQTMTRTLNTTITTLLCILMIVILGVQSVKIFAIPIVVGVVAGTYSSVCLAGPLWAFLQKVNFKKTKA